jgi:hypothetical protein
MALGITQRDKRRAFVGVKVKRADGREVDFGTISNRPILGKLQALLVNLRIKKYRMQQRSEK